MGAQFLLLQLSFTTTTTTSPPPPLPSLLNLNKSSKSNTPVGGPQWAWKKNNAGPTSSGPFSFNLEDELYTHGLDRDDDDDEFGFSGTAKQRVWWFNDDDDDDDDVWDVDFEENEFWVFKVTFKIVEILGSN